MKINPPSRKRRVSLRLNSDVEQDLRRYRAMLNEESDRGVSLSWVIGAMCEQYMARDPEFRRGRRNR